MVKLPDVLDGVTMISKTPCGNLHLTIHEHKGKPVMVSGRIGKNGTCAAAQIDGFCRLANWGLARGGDLGELVSELKGISCSNGTNPCPSAIARGIETYYKRKEKTDPSIRPNKK